jgi:hypothetical protein
MMMMMMKMTTTMLRKMGQEKDCIGEREREVDHNQLVQTGSTC